MCCPPMPAASCKPNSRLSTRHWAIRNARSRPSSVVKVSTKLELQGNLVTKVNVLIIGGAMANTFLAAQESGKSLQEAEMHDTARRILDAGPDRRSEVCCR